MSLFPVIEPPPGGLTRFKAAMAVARHRRPWQLPVELAVLAVLLVIGVFSRALAGADLAGDAQRAMNDAAPGQVVLTNGAAVRLPSSNPQVVFYRVATLGDADDASPFDRLRVNGERPSRPPR